MKYPIILTETRSKHIALYYSEVALDEQLEAIDIANNEYKAFDPTGRILKLSISKSEKKVAFLKFNREHIIARETPVSDPDTLRTKIIEYLISETATKMNVNDLVGLELEALLGILEQNTEAPDKR